MELLVKKKKNPTKKTLTDNLKGNVKNVLMALPVVLVMGINGTICKTKSKLIMKLNVPKFTYPV